jgi:hypothetical protein
MDCYPNDEDGSLLPNNGSWTAMVMLTQLKKYGHLQLSEHDDDQCCLVFTQNENQDHEYNKKKWQWITTYKVKIN